MLSYANWIAKHNKSAKFQSLSDAEKKRRYQTYLSSGPNLAYAKTSASQKMLGSPSGGKYKGKSAYAALASAMGFQLSPATHNYLTVLTNPFCPRITDVGYPDGSPAGTLKTRAFARFVVQTNAAGYGAVYLNPVFLMGGSAGISYTQSSNTMAAATFPGSTGGPGISNVGLSGLSYTTGSTGAGGISCRLVAAGVRIRSDQALLNKQGTLLTIMNPIAGGDLMGTTSDMILGPYAAYAGWHQLNTADNPWYSAVWSPTAPSGGQFVRVAAPADVPSPDAIYYPLSAMASFGAYSLGILISGAPSATFDCEVVEWLEQWGSYGPIIDNATPSYSDPIGTSVVEAVYAQRSLNAAQKSADGGLSASAVLSLASNAVNAMSKVANAYSSAAAEQKDVADKMAWLSSAASQVPAAQTIAPTSPTPSQGLGSSLQGFIADAAPYVEIGGAILGALL